MTYFENEVWDTGGDGRITITGDIYSTADPLSIYVGTIPTKSVEFFAGGVNVIGELQIDGVPVNLGGTTVVEDLAPGTFGANETPGVFTFADGLAITKASGTALSVEVGLTSFSYASDGVTNAQLNLGVLLESTAVIEVTDDLMTIALSGVTPLIQFNTPTDFTEYVDIIGTGPSFRVRSSDSAHAFEIELDDTGTSTSTDLYLTSANTNLQIQAFCDTVTPANDRIYMGSTAKLEFNFLAIELFTLDSQGFQLNGEIVPSLEFTQTTSGTNFTVDWYDGSVQKVTINASVTISFANPIAGRTYVLIIEQGTGGSRVPTLTGWNFGDNAPVWSTTVGAKDVVSAVYDGTEYLAAQAVQNA